MIAKTCGNCESFVRIKKWGNGRNGLCNILDWNCHADCKKSPHKCNKHKTIKYNRRKNKLVTHEHINQTPQDSVDNKTKFRNLVKQSGLSLTEVAKVLETPYSTVKKWHAAGCSKVPLHTVWAMESYLKNLS